MNLPVLPETKNTLYVGLGGGYDIFGAIPIHEKLRSNAVFCNVSTDVKAMGHHKFYTLDNKSGVSSHVLRLQRIVDEHNIDTIIGVDGGVDCLMRGDEVDSGTVLQDFITLAAIDSVQVQNKILACVGFGAETDEGMNHYRVLENISALVRDNAFYGSCSLVGDMAEYAVYKTAVENWSSKRKSHIQSKIIAATEGGFGNPVLDADPNLAAVVFDQKFESFINPLMSMYWFFRLDAVVKHNLIIPTLRTTRTITEALIKYRSVVTRVRDKKTIPL